jgi:hypothetical protein
MMWGMARRPKVERRQVVLSTHSYELLNDESIDGEEVLMLTPGQEGTSVVSPAHLEEAALLLNSGLTVAEVALPHVAPSNPEQLALFEA